MSRESRSYARHGNRHGGRLRGRQRDPFTEFADRMRAFLRNVMMRAGGVAMIVLGGWLLVALASFTISDPSFNTATPADVRNMGGPIGAVAADLSLQWIGGAAFLLIAPLMIWGGFAMVKGAPEETPADFWHRLIAAPVAISAGAAFVASWPPPADWPYVVGSGGLIGCPET